MANDKTESGAPTNSVRPDVGKTAAEGARQGKQGNDAFKGGMNPKQGPPTGYRPGPGK